MAGKAARLSCRLAISNAATGRDAVAKLVEQRQPGRVARDPGLLVHAGDGQ